VSAKSPLQTDKELVKEFGISEAAELAPNFKLGYVRTQIDEFKKVLWRNRVDALISEYLIAKAKADKNDALEGRFRENLSRYRNDIKQLSQSIDFMESLKNELEGLVPSDQPEQ